MKPRDVFIIALRVVGILAGFQCIAQLSGGVWAVSSAISGTLPGRIGEGGGELIVMRAIQWVLFAVATVVLIFAAPRIADYFYRDADEDRTADPQPLRLAHLYRIGAQLLGLLAWFHATPLLAILFWWAPWKTPPRFWEPALIGQMIQFVVYLMLGLYLVFGSRGLSRALARMQYRPPQRAAAAESNCIYCGYDLRGLTKPRCPECGREFDKRIVESAEAGVE